MIRRWSEPPVEKGPSKPLGFDDYDLRIGDVMRGERATMGKSLLDVQRELKIKASFIAAIENADVSAFETPGFIAGFVRSYARYLNLDPEWAFAKFCEDADFRTVHGMSSEASRPRAPQPSARPDRPSAPRDPFSNPDTPFAPKGESMLSRIEPGALGSLAVLVALIGVIGYGGWSVLQEIQRVQFAPVDQAPGVLAEADVLAADGEDFARLAEHGGPAMPAPDTLDRLYRPEALETPVLIARDGPIAALDPAEVGALAPEGAGPVVARADAPALGAPVARATPDPAPGDEIRVLAEAPPEVVLFAVRPSWVRVRAADGTVLLEKILDAGERYVLPVTEEAPTLRTGNAGSVYFSVKGETFGPAGVGAAVVSDIALSAEALTGQFEVADATQDSDLARIVASAEALGAEADGN